MKIGKKLTDFIKLEDGNIGRKSAVVTGALLASTLLGAVLTSAVHAYDHCDIGYSAYIASHHYAQHVNDHIDHYQDCPY